MPPRKHHWTNLIFGLKTFERRNLHRSRRNERTLSLCILQISLERRETIFNCTVRGREKEEDYFLHVLQNLAATSKESMPRFSKRCLFMLLEQLTVRRPPGHKEEYTSISTKMLSGFPIHPSNTFIPLDVR